MANKYISIDKELQDFRNYLKRKRMAESTIVNRCKIIKQYILDSQILIPTADDVKRHVNSMKERNLSGFTINNFLTAIDNFVSFKGGKPLNLPRVDKKSNKVQSHLTQEQVSKLLSATDNVREKALIAVLAYAGLISQEVCRLKTKDLSLNSNEIRIRSGRKHRKVYISDECCELLKIYLSEYMRSENEYLFTTLRKRERYPEYALRRLVKKVTKKAKLKTDVSPRDFRHSLAIHLIENRARTVTIIDQLGHKDYTIITKYEKRVINDSKTDYKECVPNYMSLKR